MNDSKHTHKWEDGKFVKYCTEDNCLVVKDKKTGKISALPYIDFMENTC